MLPWYEIVAVDPEALSGQRVSRIMAILVKLASIDSIMVTEVEGARVGSLSEDWEVFESRKCVSLVAGVAQFDWAFFFLARNPRCFESPWTDVKEIMTLVDITVRLADDTYVYLYLRDPGVASKVLPELERLGFSKITFATKQDLTDLEIL